MADQPTQPTAECDTCGETHPLRPSGRTFAGSHAVDGERCIGRPKVDNAPVAPGKRVKQTAEAPTGECRACERRNLGMRGGKLSIHKDLKLNVRCPGSLKAPDDVPANAPKPPAQPKKQTPKVKRPVVVITPEGKAQAKAAAFALSIKEHGWRTEFESNPADLHPLTGDPTPSVTAVAKRGPRTDQETMRITWWGAACIGGDNRITWAYKDRTVAVRNAAACKARAQVAHEVLVEESMKIAVRKVSKDKGKARRGRLKPVNLPFDPATVTDEELIDRIVGRAVTWHNALADKQETAQVKPNTRVVVKHLKNKPGERTITVNTPEGYKSFHLSKLVTIG